MNRQGSETFQDWRKAMGDTQPFIACNVCGRTNPLASAFCSVCRSRISFGAGEVPEQQPTEERNDKTPRRSRRMVVRTTFIVAVVGLAAWLVYINVGPFRFLSPPASNISSIHGLHDWAMSQRGLDRNAFVNRQATIPSGKLRWRYQSGTTLYVSPAVVSDRVYLATGDGRIVALDAVSGDTYWEYASGDPVKSSPAVAGNSIFVGLQDGRVIALHKDTGKLLWEFKTGNPVLSSPVIYDGVLYIGSNDWRMYAIDARTGKGRWSFKASNVIRSDPAVHPPVLAFTDLDGKLYILDLDTGKRRFDYQAANGAEGGAVFNDNRLYLADAGGRVRAVDWTQQEFPFEKTIKWVRFQLRHFGLIDTVGQQKGFVWFFLERNDKFITTPVVAWNKVYAASSSGKLIALDQDSGSQVWEFKSEDSFEASPSMVGDILFAADTGGRLHAIDALSGEKIWEFRAVSPITSTPVISNGVLFLTAQDGTLYAME